jgi:hypothetical protein
MRYRFWAKNPNKTYPMNVVAHESGFYSSISLYSHRPMLQKIEKNHHETFNYQGAKFLIHNPYELFSKRSAIHTTISNSTIAVYLDPQKTISDEVLNDYDPKKFDFA